MHGRQVLGQALRRQGPGPLCGPRGRQLASGSLAEVKKIATFFGLEFEEESGQFTHNLRTAVIAPDGTVVRVYRGNDWKPEELVADLKEAVTRR